MPLSLLRKLNFEDLIRYDVPDPSAYTFEQYQNAGGQHPEPLAFCTECERGGFSEAIDAPGFRLRNVSHGAHSRDFLDALNPSVDWSDWNASGVLFVFESPSSDPLLFQSVTIDGVEKRPTREWYWVHGEHPPHGYPDSFVGGQYGNLIRSAIITFELRNAYVTNLVKCGLNDELGGQFKGIASFHHMCINTCYARFLEREVSILEPKVIFAFGSNVYSKLQELVGPRRIRIQQLPHPAGRRRGFRNEHYETLFLFLMARALVAEGVVTEESAIRRFREFLSHALPIR